MPRIHQNSQEKTRFGRGKCGFADARQNEVKTEQNCTRRNDWKFRKGGDCTFLVEELKAVFDPQGGYFKPGGKFMPSLVAEIGWAIEDHLQKIGMLKKTEIPEHQQKIMDEKRAEFEGTTAAKEEPSDFPANAEVCKKCSVKAVIL